MLHLAAARCASEKLNYTSEYDQCSPALTTSFRPAWWYSRQLVRLNKIIVMGSNPEWNVPPYVGQTILLLQHRDLY